MEDAGPSEPPRMDGGPAASSSGTEKPLVVLVIGMAGSGKTTFMQRMNSHYHSKVRSCYRAEQDDASRVSHTPWVLSRRVHRERRRT